MTPPDEKIIAHLTDNPFRRGYSEPRYIFRIEGAHKGTKNVYREQRTFHDDYLTPTSTEHILDTVNQPNTANKERANTLERLHDRNDEMYASYDTTPPISDDITATATNPGSRDVNTTTNAIEKMTGVCAATVLATNVIAAAGIFDINATEYLTAMGAGTAGFLATKAAHGLKATYHARRTKQIHREHKEQHYHDNTEIKARVMKPLMAHAQTRQANRESIETLVNNAAQNQE